MARIRTIKPEFFRDEELQDLQAKHPALHPMLVFAGLWTVADKAGRFEWKPRTLHLDILPFLDFDMVQTLALLEQAGMVVRYTVEGKEYGLIPTFGKHQRITGKEAQSPERYPGPEQGSTREAPGKHPGAQERKGKRKGKDIFPADAGGDPLPGKEESAGDVWLDRTKELWPKNQPDGNAAPRSASAEVARRWGKILKAGEATAEELAFCALAYTRAMAKDRHYVVSLETFLGPKLLWPDYLPAARDLLARKRQQDQQAAVAEEVPA
jgi:hypothetical protein